MQQELDWKRVESVQEICMMAPTRQLAEKARAIIAAVSYTHLTLPTILLV